MRPGGSDVGALTEPALSINAWHGHGTGGNTIGATIRSIAVAGGVVGYLMRRELSERAACTCSDSWRNSELALPLKVDFQHLERAIEF